MTPILAGLLLSVAAVQARAEPAPPKEVVQAFMDLAFVQGRATEAARLYISPERYRQHNPQAVDGREAFITGFGRFVEQSCKQRPAIPRERGAAVVDIFRVESGLIVEHWDVEQAVPAHAANRNTMF
jgi:predicted SnoaL-like aldol condensation-catalyzing enzyme